MSEYPDGARPAVTFAEAEDALLSRWPEHRLDPTLDRIVEFVQMLGEPQRNYPVIHLTGTNGKTSTARMIESLLISVGLRTGRFTSPHLQSMNERIVIDGQPIDEQAFVDAFNDIAPFTHMVDASNAHPLSFFETIVAMAYAAFSDAPVDVAVVEVGMGGAWDATNIADGQVAVLTPIAVDHAAYLGSDPVTIAREKVGIIKPGAEVISAAQLPEVLDVIAERCTEVGATLRVEGIDFRVESRSRLWVAKCSRSLVRGGTTPISSFRCTALTKHKTSPWRLLRSRPSSVGRLSVSRSCPRDLRR
jgi:dihydrofolate synthase/folylpolyglutamate synthase